MKKGIIILKKYPGWNASGKEETDKKITTRVSSMFPGQNLTLHLDPNTKGR